jgi:hypothetical protein
VPLPGPDPTISSSAVHGLPIDDALFPRNIERRIDVPQEPGDATVFLKRGAELLDYSADLSPMLEEDEVILACYAWSDVPADLVISDVRFGTKGALFFAFGGVDGSTYSVSMMISTSQIRTIEVRAILMISESAGDAMTTFRPPTIGTIADPAQSYLTDVTGAFLSPTYTDASGAPLFPVVP